MTELLIIAAGFLGLALLAWLCPVTLVLLFGLLAALVFCLAISDIVGGWLGGAK